MVSAIATILVVLAAMFAITTSSVHAETVVTAQQQQSQQQIVVGDLSNPDAQGIQLQEDHRVAEYHKRNYTWPLDNYSPNTPGWKALMERRFRQVEQLQDTGRRYDAYIQTIHSAFLVPNFTEHGFGLAKCPDELLGALQQGIRHGLAAGDATLEPGTEVIDGPNQPLFINRPDLTDRVLQELRHYAETWAQIPLTPYRAYGFRLYRNESKLYMHVDKMQTHIISFILHIDSSEDAEPWPIYIEDFQGRTHEVILKPGDMLFYESSKCFHGRPKKFNGSWYSSIFVHYYPKHGWYEQNHELEAHYAVPPHWSQQQVLAPSPYSQQQQQQDESLPRMEMVGTSMKEPDCPNDWCATLDSVQWSGPAEEGKWIAPTFERYPFEPQHVIWNEEL